jgi:hypothetical protein
VATSSREDTFTTTFMNIGFTTILHSELLAALGLYPLTLGKFWGEQRTASGALHAAKKLELEEAFVA